MKRILFASAFLAAIGGAVAFKPGNDMSKKGAATQTVFYKIGAQTNCPNTKLCSNINNLVLCEAGVSTYFDQATCTPTSDYKWRP